MSTLKIAIAIAVVAALLGVPAQPVFAQAPGAPGWHEDQSLAVDGTTRWFRYYVPENPLQPVPVVVLLHGGGGNSQRVTNSSAGAEWVQIAAEAGFILAVPDGTDVQTGAATGDSLSWNDCRTGEKTSDTDDVAFVDALLEWFDLRFQLDPQRVYATGPSNGGMMTYRLLQELPGRIAAGAAYVASLPQPGECEPAGAPRSVMIVNGDEDPLTPWEGGPVAGGDRGSVISAQATRDHWIDVNETWGRAVTSTQFADIAPGDGSVVTSSLYQGGRLGTEVRFDRVEGGGHTVPSLEHFVNPILVPLLGPQNRDIESIRQAWDFLARQRRDGRESHIARPAGLTRAWSDPGSAGEGLVIVMSEVGLGVYYFGNDSAGGRLWLISGIFNGELVWGEPIEFSMRPGAGTFDEPSVAGADSSWGTLTLTFLTCGLAEAVLDGIDGQKTLNLQPIVATRGVACSSLQDID